MARKSSDLLHRSCWVALEIHTLRTSPRMEVPLGTIYVSCQKSSYIFPKISEWKTQRQTTLIHIADSNVIQKNVDKQCLISREEKVLHTTIQFIDNNDNQFCLQIHKLQLCEDDSPNLTKKIWNHPQAKLYIPSTLNIDLILWHTHLIVCA